MIIEKYCHTEYASYGDFCYNFNLNVPGNFNFAYDVMDGFASLRPDARALVWCNDKGDSRSFTFGDMKRLSDRCSVFLSSAGIKKGDFVLLMLRSRYEYWITMLALHKIGAVAVPATHQLTGKDIVYRVRAAEISTIITVDDNAILDVVDNAQKELIGILKRKITVGAPRGDWLDYWQGMDNDGAFSRPAGAEATNNDDLLLVYFTSGTTGMPKMVAQTHTYPLGHIVTAKFWHNLDENDLIYSHADTGWAKCSWGKMYGQWLCGAAVCAYDYETRFIPTDLLRVIEQNRVTVFCAPPTVFRFFIKEDLSQYDLSSLRHCCIAGEPLNAEVYNKWLEMTGLELREGFGQSETCVMIGTFLWLDPRPGSTGRPAPHFGINLVDEDGSPVEPGEEGEICIDISKGIPAGVFIGYYKDEQLTNECMRAGWYRTGDMAWRDEDGYYWFIGRSDDVIKSSGYRIGPFEVESALLEHPAVLESAITAVPDEERGQIVKATVVLARGYEASEALVKELQNHVKKTTAPYKYPRIIEFADELPRTISGKIRRRQIRDADSGVGTTPDV